MSINEFIQDMKDMVNKKDISVVKEKYLKPAFNATKSAAETTWNFIVVNTPKVIAAGKEAIAKGQDAINQMKNKKGEVKTETTQKTEVKTEIKVDKTEENKSQNNPPPPPKG